MRLASTKKVRGSRHRTCELFTKQRNDQEVILLLRTLDVLERSGTLRTERLFRTGAFSCDTSRDFVAEGHGINYPIPRQV